MRDLLRAHLDRRGFDDVEIVTIGELLPAKTPLDSPIVRAAIETWHDLGEERAYIAPMTGGSGPLSLITGTLGIPTVMAGGVASADSRVHSPNESIALDDFKQGIRYWGRFIHRLASAGA
jgi:acetylornithine deacetylase/succinyl-diaminopimelate desuccinylase-like protein